MFYFHPYLGKIPILTNNFQMGWNHQLDNNSGQDIIPLDLIKRFVSPPNVVRWRDVSSIFHQAILWLSQWQNLETFGELHMHIVGKLKVTLPETNIAHVNSHLSW